jgi:3-hydroxyisobutyrate dehydrogenase
MCANVAVLGLGIMGSAMARDAARAGMDVNAWARNPDRAARLASGKLHPATTPIDAVRDTDLVVTMVSDADAVLDVMQERGTLAAMKSGAAWVQMSTIGVEGTDRAMRLAATRPEIVFIDAPVSGSKELAEEGKLVILASGDQTRAGAIVQRYFDAIGSHTFWLGSAGQGTRMKLMFNAWLAVLMEGVAEVAILGNSLGVAPERFASLASGGPLVPPWAIAKLKKIAEKAYRGDGVSPPLGPQRRSARACCRGRGKFPPSGSQPDRRHVGRCPSRFRCRRSKRCLSGIAAAARHRRQ